MLYSEEFFDYAEILLADIKNISEIAIRTAINRIHYGIFHKAIQIFNIKFITQKEKETCHKIVRNRIEDEVSDYSTITLYKNLEALRNKSDYELNISLDINDFKKSREIKEALLNIFQTNPIYLGGDEEILKEFQHRKRSRKK